MNARRFAHAFAPLAALILPVLLSACDGVNVEINGDEGKLLSQLDLTGTPPHGLVLLGPDTVNIVQGDKLAITVSGDAEATKDLRFTLKDGTLGVLRKSKLWSGHSNVVVNVTMPAPTELVMTGSGKINAAALAAKAKITVAGSGDVVTDHVASDQLEVTIAGSGSYHAAGTTKVLELNIAGSGSADMGALKAGQAKVSIAGSGNTGFASDGDVKASIMGSGSVRVSGRATCTVSMLGSGKLVCEPGNGPVKTKDDD